MDLHIVLSVSSSSLLCLAGYNHYEIAEFLLENGSDPNATDKGGLIGEFFFV